MHANGDSNGNANGDPSAANTPETLVRQDHHLYSQLTGLPWVPTGYTLDAAGKVTANLGAAVNGIQTTLVRATEAGLKLVRWRMVGYMP